MGEGVEAATSRSMTLVCNLESFNIDLVKCLKGVRVGGAQAL